jgi:cytohesin
MQVSALHLAALEGRLDIMQALIDKGADKDIQDSMGLTPLHWAIMAQQRKAVTMLIKNHAQVNATDNSQRSPLHLAILYGLTDEVQELVVAGADKEAECQMEDGKSQRPLYLAALGNYAAIINILAAAQVNLNVQEQRLQKTALHIATEEGNLAAMRALIAAGANRDVHDANGFTPLHIAVTKGYSEAVNILIAAGADINAQDSFHLRTPLQIATERQDRKMVEILLEAGANRMVRDSNGVTPLQYAAGRKDFDIFQALVHANSNINSQDLTGVTPLHYAAGNGNLEAVKALIAAGADASTQDSSGATPLHKAIRAYDKNKPTIYDIVARYLIRSGGQGLTGIYDSEGQTPLHIAVQQGNLRMAEYLLRYHADVDALDAERNTPLHFATSLQMRNKLLRHGADFSICNCAGQNPIARNINIWIQDFKNPNI